VKKKELERIEAYKAAGDVVAMLFYGGLVKAMMPKIDVVILDRQKKAKP